MSYYKYLPTFNVRIRVKIFDTYYYVKETYTRDTFDLCRAGLFYNYKMSNIL